MRPFQNSRGICPIGAKMYFHYNFSILLEFGEPENRWSIFFFFKFYYLISFYCFLYFFFFFFSFLLSFFFVAFDIYIYTNVWQKLVFSTLWFLKLNRLSFWYPFSLSLLPESLWCFFTVLHFSLFFIAGILFLMLFSYLQDRIFSFECKNFSKSKSRCTI